LILRLRKIPGDSDATVKLRSKQELPLDASWADKFTIEGDWSGTNKMVSASLKTNVADSMIDAAVPPGGKPGLGFTALQTEFLENGCSPPVEMADLAALGPVRAYKWSVKKLLPEPFEKVKLNFERWEIPNLAFLEFSVRVDYDLAPDAQKELKRLLKSHGVTVDEDQQPKTSRVLRRLAGLPEA